MILQVFASDVALLMNFKDQSHRFSFGLIFCILQGSTYKWRCFVWIIFSGHYFDHNNGHLFTDPALLCPSPGGATNSYNLTRTWLYLSPLEQFSINGILSTFNWINNQMLSAANFRLKLNPGPMPIVQQAQLQVENWTVKLNPNKIRLIKTKFDLPTVVQISSISSQYYMFVGHLDSELSKL